MRARTIGLMVRLTCLAVLTAGGAHAASEEDKAAAEALFDAGRKLMADHKYDEACPKLADSQRLDPGVGTLLNLALCYKQSGKTASAWSTFREAAAEAREQGQPDRETMARQEAEQLEARLTRLKLVVAPAIASLDGLQISRDGKPIVNSLWTVPVPVDPGSHTLEVSAPGRQAVKLSVDAREEGRTVEVVIPEPQLASAAAASPSATAAPTAPSAQPVSATPSAPIPGATPEGSVPGAERPTGSPAVGYVIAGVGVVGLGVGTVFGLQAASKNDQALKICPDPNGPCSQTDVNRHATLVTDAKSARTGAYVGLGVGVVALGTGIVLIVTSSRAKSSASAPLVVPFASASCGGLSVSGAW